MGTVRGPGLAWAMLFVPLAFAGCLSGEEGPATAGGPLQEPGAPGSNTYRAPEPPPAAGTIRGTVVDEAERPLAAVRVEVKDRDIPAVGTGADGRFEFAGLASGDYVLLAGKLGYDAAAVPVHLAAGQVAEVAIALKAVAVESPPEGRTVVLNGTIACGASPVTQVTGLPVFTRPQRLCTASLGENSRLPFLVARGARTVQAEVAWSPVATTGAQELRVYLDAREDKGGSWRDMRLAEGPGPLRLRIDEGQHGLAEPFPFEQAAQNVTWRVDVFVAETFHPRVVYQQPFRVHVTTWFNATAPENYTALP